MRSLEEISRDMAGMTDSCKNRSFGCSHPHCDCERPAAASQMRVMTRERAVQIACAHAAREGRAYYDEGFVPHDWVVNAILEAANANAAVVEKLRDAHDLLDVHLGDTDLDYFETEEEEREGAPGQVAARLVMQAIDALTQ